MRTLTAQGIIDPELGAHYALIRTMRDITELHDHDFYEFFLVTAGRIQHVVNGRRELLHPGSLVLIRPQDQHCYERHGSDDCALVNLAFGAATLEALVAYLGVRPDALVAAELPPHRVLLQSETEGLAARLRALGAPQPGAFRMEARALLAELLVHLTARSDGAPQQSAPDWLEPLCHAMQKPENFTAGLPRLHALAPVSPEHLCRTMGRYLGKTPTQWVNELRLAFAAELLVRSDEEIMAVCLRAGFENLSHFYHLFRQQYHMTPARYRKTGRGMVVPQ